MYVKLAKLSRFTILQTLEGTQHIVSLWVIFQVWCNVLVLVLSVRLNVGVMISQTPDLKLQTLIFNTNRNTGLEMNYCPVYLVKHMF